MGIFSVFKRKSANPANSSYMAELMRLNGATWSARDFIAFALEGFRDNSTVRACVRAIIDGAKECPVILVGPGGKVVPRHPILNQLAKPNPQQAWRQFIEQAIVYRIIGGEAPVYGMSLVEGSIRPHKELWVLRPDWLQEQEATTVGVDSWIYTPVNPLSSAVSSNPRIQGKDMCVWKEFNPLNFNRGLSVLWSVAKEIDVLNKYNDSNKSLMDNGMQPSGVFSTETGLSDTSYSRLKKELDDKHAGWSNSGKPLLLEGGLKWQTSGMTMRDAEFIGGTKQAQMAVCRVIRVPTQIVNIEGSQTFANYEQARAALYEDVVIPMVNDFLGSLLDWQISKYPDLKAHTLRVDVDAVAALEPRRAERNKNIDGMSTLTVDEKREAMGYTPAASNGDVILVDSSKVPLDLVGASVQPPNDLGGY